MPLLAGVVQGQEGLLVGRVGVGARPQEELRHAEEAAAGGLVKDRLVVLRNRWERRKKRFVLIMCFCFLFFVTFLCRGGPTPECSTLCLITIW